MCHLDRVSRLISCSQTTAGEFYRRVFRVQQRGIAFWLFRLKVLEKQMKTLLMHTESLGLHITKSRVKSRIITKFLDCHQLRPECGDASQWLVFPELRKVYVHL